MPGRISPRPAYLRNIAAALIAPIRPRAAYRRNCRSRPHALPTSTPGCAPRSRPCRRRGGTLSPSMTPSAISRPPIASRCWRRRRLDRDGASAAEVARLIRQIPRWKRITAVFMENIANPPDAAPHAAEAGTVSAAALCGCALRPDGPAPDYEAMFRQCRAEVRHAEGRASERRASSCCGRPRRRRAGPRPGAPPPSASPSSTGRWR